VPILCGGTGLYFKALLEGVGAAPPANPALRTELEKTPLPDLLRELAERDPVLFGQIDRQNLRRVVRALEVIRLTGRPFSAQRAPWGRAAVSPAGQFLGLTRRAEDLRARIEARVEAMFREGLVEETAALLERGLARNPAALQALGYRQVVEHLRGERSRAETIARVKQRTRQFARRQMTWFRKHAAVTWLEVAPGEEPAHTAARVIALWGRVQDAAPACRADALPRPQAGGEP
jgi:tRNA dimethylallyltransferase